MHIQKRGTVLDGELGLRTAATGVSRISVTAELNHLVWLQVEHVLEVLADTFKTLTALERIRSLILAALGRLASGSGPQTHTPECLADVDHDSHHLVVALILEHLANRGEHDVEPGLVTGLCALVSVCPASTVLVLLVLPLWSHALLEEVVVGLLRELGCWCDVVLERVS